MSKRPYPRLFQMFGGYLHQDWMYDFIWDEGEKPHFKAAIEAYKEDCQEIPEYIDKAIQELDDLIGKNYSTPLLENQIFRELGIYVIPTSYGLTHQQFLIEVLRILKE